jgi:hypothetical protein
MSKRFTSKNPSTPQGKRGRLRKKEKFNNKTVTITQYSTLSYIATLRFQNLIINLEHNAEKKLILCVCVSCYDVAGGGEAVLPAN